MTAEIQKGRYIYYHCTGHRGRCGNTYVREEDLRRLLADVSPISFAVFDRSSKVVDLEAGIGFGLTNSSNRLTLKVMLSFDLAR
jgi:hypothetical protein